MSRELCYKYTCTKCKKEKLFVAERCTMTSNYMPPQTATKWTTITYTIDEERRTHTLCPICTSSMDTWLTVSNNKLLTQGPYR